MALYDTLVDDDDDVRDQGAATVSSLLSAVASDASSEQSRSLSLSSPAAKSRMLCYLCEGYCTSPKMGNIAIGRLTGLRFYPGKRVVIHTARVVHQIELRPVAEICADARRPQKAVFVEEKQNLYIDTVEEAEAWAEVLVGLLDDAWDTEATAALENWTLEGLMHLCDLCKEGKDDALGLTSIPEVFTLFMRVILSAKVLIKHSSKTIANASSTEDRCRKLIAELLEIGKRSSLHELLIERCENILGTVNNVSPELRGIVARP